MIKIINNTPCVPARLLFEELKVISYTNYKQKCYRGQLKVVVRGGNGRQTMVEFASLPEEWKKVIRDI